MEDFEDILSTGSIPDILKFMKEKNLFSPDNRFKMSDVYWLLKDQTFFNESISILSHKNIYDQTIWSYSIFHKNASRINEYFQSMKKHQRSIIGAGFKSSLVKFNDEEQKDDEFNFLDYYPLVNSRAHRMGGMESDSSANQGKRWILNN